MCSLTPASKLLVTTKLELCGLTAADPGGDPNGAGEAGPNRGMPSKRGSRCEVALVCDDGRWEGGLRGEEGDVVLRGEEGDEGEM